MLMFGGGIRGQSRKVTGRVFQSLGDEEGGLVLFPAAVRDPEEISQPEKM